MLCSGFNWISSPAATELEMIVMDWVGKMLNLPHAFLFSSGNGGGGGVIQGTTCEAIVCTLASARDNALKKFGEDKINKLIVYGSDQTLFIFHKVAKIVGIAPRNVRSIPTSSTTCFALSPNDVHMAMSNDLATGLIPLFLCATVGTIMSTAVDPLEGLGPVAREFGVWLHVDAAYVGSDCICPELRHYLNGVERADSISVNAHKWFLTNMDCCCLWLKNSGILLESLSSTPEILRNKASESKEVVDYKDWQIALARRFRALKLWLVIRRYGVANLMTHIRSDIELAKHFEALVVKDHRFEIVVPRKFALVCFRVRPNREEDGSKLNWNLLEAVNSSGRAYMTHAVLGGIFVIRCAIGGTLTEKCNVDGLWKLIQEKTDILSMKNVTM